MRRSHTPNPPLAVRPCRRYVSTISHLPRYRNRSPARKTGTAGMISNSYYYTKTDHVHPRSDVFCVYDRVYIHSKLFSINQSKPQMTVAVARQVAECRQSKKKERDFA